jgi:hypothetical protein
MSVIITQTTNRFGKCPTCGKQDVWLADVMELPTRRILEIRCEDCWDEEERDEDEV